MRPGIISKDADGKLNCKTIFSRVLSLFAEKNDLQVFTSLVKRVKDQY